MGSKCRLGALFAQYSQQTRAQNSFSLAISKRLEFVKTTDNLKKGLFQFPLQQCDCHAFAMPKEGQTVHGGVLSLLVEDTTTMHLCASDSRNRQAVTTDLNLSFLGVGKVGRTLEIKTEVLKVGSVLGVAGAWVHDAGSGKLLAVGRHTVMFVGEDDSATSYSTSLDSVFDV
mmetsp:Transcript_30382/g.66558  ORF Transcript_30382/g.66558 Transcript_30382/m.66558 type:complete len:172 (+) Transcript_30382:68-583(+)|eukprot:CAMPEP_0170607474 /NCGR_PEP_ID=MMETSP0224-20130122/21074_1 /TAXON_ID=285029 /ORGANISM="Togula jolla, Strain CCCM 725" /LENGTH=171 /DNA_ID=CAMNT_0010932643 /DNA_START=64 /DNA_END=579 /DNA_ORIENTATION=+